jgi:hypothetical protein
MDGWPPIGGGQPPPVPGPDPGGFPPASWPSKDQLEYARTLIVVVLLLPWVAKKIITDPAELFSGAGKRVIKSGPVA